MLLSIFHSHLKTTATISIILGFSVGIGLASHLFTEASIARERLDWLLLALLTVIGTVAILQNQALNLASQALQRWQDTFKCIHQGMAVGSTDGWTLEQVNPAFANLYGFTVEELAGQPILELFAPQCRDGLTAYIQAAHQQGHHIFEAVHLHKNGHQFPVEIDVSVIYDRDSRTSHPTYNIKDISKHKSAETALRLSEACFKRAQSVAQIGSWALDEQRNGLTWTAEHYRIFGIPESTPPTYKTFLACVHPDDRHYVRRMWKRALKGEVYDIEHRLLVNGEVRWVRQKADLEFDTDGQLIAGIGITQDITVRKQSESILRESEEKLRGLFELSPLGISLTDMQGRYIEFNRAFRRMTGYDHEELCQLDYWQLTPKKYAADEARQLESLNCTGQYGPYEKEYIRKNGSLIPLRLNGISLEGRDGKKYIWSIVEDISERRQNEEQLRIKNAEQKRLLAIQASILDTLPANIALIDQQGIIRQTNRRWLLFAVKYGANEAKVGIGSDYLAVCDHAAHNGDSDAARIAQEIRQILANGNGQFSCEYPCHQPKVKQWFLLQVVSIPINNRSGAVVMHVDITESYLAKEQLHKREEEFRALVENSPDIIIRFDSQCHYLYVNPTVEATMGVPARHYKRKTLDHFGLSDLGLNHARETIMSVFADGMGHSTEFSFKVGQTIRHFHTQFIPEYDQQNTVASVLVVMRDVTDSKNFEIALSQSRQQLREMAAQTEMTREQERKRIAREVHDELGQNLTALRMDVSLLRLEYAGDNPALLERFKATLGLVDRAIKNVRNVTTNLRPAVLDMGLLDSLKWLCNEFTDHSGIPCKLHYTDDYYLIDEPRAVQIFRIMQESLTNIARHAHARHVDVTLRCHGHRLCLDVRDDGIGFDLGNQNQKSFGLLGIRERAIVLGGDVDIMSVLGQGTTVALQIPLD